MRATAVATVALAAAATTASAARITDVQCPAKCASDLDCSLNGVCNTGTGTCTCDTAWTGACCTALNLLPVALNSSYRHPLTSTWGGNIIVDAASGTHHMWIAEMAPAGVGGDPGAGSCGLTTWSSNSQITHVTSSSLEGPYARQEVVLPIWSHNPIVRLFNESDGSQTYVLYHIGSGSGGAPGDGYCGKNATSPCGEQSFDQCEVDTCVAVPGYACSSGYCSGDALADGDCGADIAEPTLNGCSSYAECAPLAAAACAATSGCVSFGLSQAWGFGKAKLFSAGKGGLTPNSQWTTWVANGHDNDMYARARAEGRWPVPPPAVAADGSCTLQVAASKSSAGPWTPITNVTINPCAGNNPSPWLAPNGTVFFVATDDNMGLWRAPSWRGPYELVTTGACGGGEDPSLYLDKKGRFHCLYHRSPFSDPDIAIGHAYSLDGFTWYVAAAAAANSTIVYEGLGAVVHGKRERPHLYMNPAGDIEAFVTGVCIIPACNPLEGSIDPNADCSSGGQYHNCDANSPFGWYDRTYTLVQRVQLPKA